MPAEPAADFFNRIVAKPNSRIWGIAVTQRVESERAAYFNRIVASIRSNTAVLFEGRRILGFLPFLKLGDPPIGVTKLGSNGSAPASTALLLEPLFPLLPG